MAQSKLPPEQQKYLDLALKQAIGFMTSGDAPEQLVNDAEKLGAEKAAIQTMMPLLQNIHASAQQSGAKVGTDVMVAVAIHVIKIMAELLVMAGVLKDNQVQGFAKTVTAQAIQQHNAQFGGAQ